MGYISHTERSPEMRIVMLMRDTEYRDAMIEMISGYDRDIFVEVAGSSGVPGEAVILTDIRPTEIEDKSLERLRDRTVFLTSVPSEQDRDDTLHILFKYSRVNTIVSELSLVYSLWSGHRGTISPSTRTIAVAGESDVMSADRCRSIAGQILYRYGGTLLIIPLGYINDYRPSSGDDGRGWFRRLMYMIDEARDYVADTFTDTDSYGISTIKLPAGPNPLPGLGYDYLSRLISSIGGRFDTVILDVGTAFSADNIRLIAESDNIIYFGNGRRIDDPALFISEESASRAKVITALEPSSEALAIDDIVSEIYGTTDQADNDS